MRARITAETLDEINRVVDRLVAVADYARHGAITDDGAAAAGFYADEGLGSPETLLYGVVGHVKTRISTPASSGLRRRHEGHGQSAAS